MRWAMVRNVAGMIGGNKRGAEFYPRLHELRPKMQAGQRAMKVSISATVRGMPVLSRSQPLAVTR